MAVNQVSTPVAYFRHPLGLPAGSVRAALVVMIVGLFWMHLLLPQEKTVTVPVYLYFLLCLVLHFFAAHGTSIETSPGPQPSPWYLPRGTFRWFIILGSAMILGWRGSTGAELLYQRLTPLPEQLPQWPQLLFSLTGGYIAGWILRHGPRKRLDWFQDIQAWISLLAMIGLGAEVIIKLFINPQLEQTGNIPLWEAVLVAVVSLYFGIRS